MRPVARTSVLVLAVVLLAGAPPEAFAQGPSGDPGALGRAIDAVLDDPVFEDAFWGAHVVDLATGEELYARNERKNFVPASNTKLFTTAAALDQLGPDYRYRTRLYVDGPVVDGLLRGNLIVRGAADPTLGGHYVAADGAWDENIDGTRVFRGWADALRGAGITGVEGDVVGDDDVVDDVALGSNWSWDDETFYYAAQLSGLTFNDNVVLLRVAATSAGAPAEITWEPHGTGYVEVVNRTRTTGPGTRYDEGYERERGTNRILVSSLLPTGRVDLEEITVANPTRYAAHVLREVLLQEGIPVAGRAVDVDEMPIKPDYADAGVRQVAVHTSPPLADVVAMTNKASQNLYAEMLLKTLAAERPGVRAASAGAVAPGSSALGIAVAKRTYARAGVDTSRLALVDGSGLSRRNLVTPAATAALLRYMGRHADEAVRSAFFGSLPVAGVEGTLEHRFRQGPAYRKVRAKTGTLGGASSLSGYVTTAGGRTLAFSLMANHYSARTSAVRAAQDDVVELLARYRR